MKSPALRLVVLIPLSVARNSLVLVTMMLLPEKDRAPKVRPPDKPITSAPQRSSEFLEFLLL
jgi:hypothetical protein